MPIRQDQFYGKVLSHVRENVSSVTPNAIYLSAIASFNADTVQAVQIVPGSLQSAFPDAGHGLCRETFDVVCWTRLLTDYGNEDTQLISDESLGLLALAGTVRSALTQKEIDAATTEPIVFIQSSRIQVSRDQPGWGFVTDSYRVAYELAWSVT